MRVKKKLWAVIPARSGSKGFPDKNIAEFEGQPLLVHSIRFAQNLSFVDKILVSTDSDKYAHIAKNAGADVPFLRSDWASNDSSMEQDVLEDIRVQCIENNITPPDSILWLRPTHPHRSIAKFEKMNEMFLTGLYDSVVAVTKEDSRLFVLNANGILGHATEKNYFQKQSMQRRQDIEPYFRMYHGEIFHFPISYDPCFLGTKIGAMILPDDCKKDIDYARDLQ